MQLRMAAMGNSSGRTENNRWNLVDRAGVVPTGN